MTSHEVARLAGVSQATVSRALRNLPGTAPDTRAAVLAAAASLGYVPIDSGRALSTSTTRRVAVVVENLTNPYYAQLVEPLRQQLLENDLRTVLVNDGDGPTVVDQLADGAYDAVILTSTRRRSPLPRDLTERRVPHVLVHRVLDVAESPSFTFDNAAGMRMIAKLAHDLGHRRVAVIDGPADTSTGRDRAVGIRASLREVGITVPRALVRQAPFDHDAGMAAALSLLGMPERPTAILCSNDLLALGVLSAARALNIQVPHELTVTGFDDVAQSGWPLIGLTTVHCDLPDLARESVGMLMRSMHDVEREPASEIRRLPVSLVERATHGRAFDE